MAAKEINDLTAKTTPVGSDELELQETSGGDSKKVTITNVMAQPGAIGGTTAAAANFTTLDATGLTTLGALTTITLDSAATNTITIAADLVSTSTGTPAAGIGVGMSFTVETAAGNNEIGGLIEVTATDVDPTNEDFDMVFSTMLSGDAATEVLRLSSAGAGQVLVQDGDSDNPSIARADDINTGLRLGDISGPIVGIVLNGTMTFRGHNTLWRASQASGPALVNEATTATNPTLLPNNADEDTGIGGAPTDVVSMIAGAVEGIRVTTTASQFTGGAANGEFLNIQSVTASAAFDADGATHTFSSLIPAGAFVLGVVTRITETIVGATTIEIGDGVDQNLWGATSAVTAGTTTDATDYTNAAAVGTLYIAANDVIVTAVGGAADFSDGTLRVTVFYMDVTAPTG